MVFKYTAAPPAITLLWQRVTQDAGSNQGDGSAEVVYAGRRRLQRT